MIVYRPLGSADAPRAAALIRAGFAEQGVETSPPSSALKESDEAVARKLQTGGGFAAFDGEALVGVVLWTPQGDALYLGRLAVAPPRRGAGIAAELVARVEAEGRQRGAASVRLHARLQLPLNRKFFAGLGYREVAEGTHAGYDRPTYAVLEKPLPGSCDR